MRQSDDDCSMWRHSDLPTFGYPAFRSPRQFSSMAINTCCQNGYSQKTPQHKPKTYTFCLMKFSASTFNAENPEVWLTTSGL